MLFFQDLKYPNSATPPIAKKKNDTTTTNVNINLCTQNIYHYIIYILSYIMQI